VAAARPPSEYDVTLRRVEPISEKLVPSTLRSTEKPTSRPPSAQLKWMASVAVAVASRDVGGRSTVTTAVPDAHTLGPSRRQRAVVWRTHSVRKPWVAMHAAIESAHTRRQRIAAGAEPAYSNVASDAATSGPNRAGCLRMRRAWRANRGPE